jgi:hypothetical protein
VPFGKAAYSGIFRNDRLSGIPTDSLKIAAFTDLGYRISALGDDLFTHAAVRVRCNDFTF